MSAGELREMMAFDKRAIIQDDYGNDVVGDFAEQFRVPARVKPMVGIGSEQVQAARLSGTQPVIIRVRQTSQTSLIGTDWQARDARKGTLYNIRSSANLDEHGIYLDILATAGEATG